MPRPQGGPHAAATGRAACRGHREGRMPRPQGGPHELLEASLGPSHCRGCLRHPQRLGRGTAASGGRAPPPHCLAAAWTLLSHVAVIEPALHAIRMYMCSHVAVVKPAHVWVVPQKVGGLRRAWWQKVRELGLSEAGPQSINQSTQSIRSTAAVRRRGVDGRRRRGCRCALDAAGAEAAVGLRPGGRAGRGPESKPGPPLHLRAGGPMAPSRARTAGCSHPPRRARSSLECIASWRDTGLR